MNARSLSDTALERAIDAYRGARPEACIAALRFDDGYPARVLRARAYLRLGRPELAIASLDFADRFADAPSAAIGEVHTLLGAARTRLFDFDGASEALELARVHAFSSGSVELEAEYRYYEAVKFFANNEFAKADREADVALHVDLALDNRFGAKHAYFVPLANTKSRALILRALVAAAAERYRESIAFLRSSIAEIEKAESADLWIYAASLKQLALNVRDFDLNDDADFLRSRIRANEWPAELDGMLFETYRGLGWSSHSRGDASAARRDFDRALNYATSDAWRVLLLVDLAQFGRECNEGTAPVATLEQACALAATVDWSAVGEERIALVQLAEALAPVSPSRASAFLETYRRIKVRLSPMYLNAFDRRVRAQELRAEAAVLLANGDRSAATLRYLDAFEIWDSLGYSGLAAHLAVELARLTGKPFFATYARRELAIRPSASLARRIAAGFPESDDVAYLDRAEPTAI